MSRVYFNRKGTAAFAERDDPVAGRVGGRGRVQSFGRVREFKEGIRGIEPAGCGDVP